MCRIAAYMGEPCRLDTFLTDPPHSLHRQSWDAREMTSATVNADGWGVGWLDGDCRPATYRHVLPIWADGNVDALGRSLHSGTWLGNVRSATAGLGTDNANTQPFCDDTLLYTHNGFIDRFAHTLRARVRAELAPAIEVDIDGNTDSEYLFALIRQQTGPLAVRVASAIELVRDWLSSQPDVRGLLNMIVCDGQQMVATRAAVNATAPSLYLHREWRAGTVVASEPFDDGPGWHRLESDSLILVTPGQNSITVDPL